MIDHKNRPRPLSPHLTIYKAEYSSMLSIYHRVTGILLAVCLLLLGLIYKLQAYNIEYFSNIIVMVSNFVTDKNLFWFSYLINLVVVFIILTVVFMLAYHMSNGIRHFIWDYILSTVSKDYIKKTSYVVIFLTILIFIGLLGPQFM